MSPTPCAPDPPRLSAGRSHRHGQEPSSLALDGSVADVRLETQQQAYERFAELFVDQPELVESVNVDGVEEVIATDSD